MKIAGAIFSFCMCFLLHGIGLSAATNDPALIKQAEEAYAAGKYDVAIEHWTHLYTQENSDPQLLINIGNAQAVTGNTAEAMMAYEKAFRFRPSDKELIRAIKQLRERNENRVEQVQSFFISRWLNVFLALFRPYVWALAGLLVLLVGVINWLYIVDLIKGKWPFTKRSLQLYCMMGLMLMAISFSSYRNIYRLNEAIVFSPCDVYQGPSGQ